MQAALEGRPVGGRPCLMMKAHDRGSHMRRFLSVLLAVGVVAFLAPPARGDVAVSLSVSQTTLWAGGQVTFSGKAVEAKPGSVVKLQRKVGSSWTTVASRKVWAARTYSFTRTPAKGYQYYGVIKPRQLGQAYAASRTVKLTVKWRPSLTLGDVTNDVDVADGSVTTTTHGSVSGLPAGFALRRELRQVDGTWEVIGSVTLSADRSWTDTFPSRHGWRLRYTAPVAGARLASSSSAFTVDGRWTPILTVRAALDSLTDVGTVTGTTTGLPEGSPLQRQYADGNAWVAQGDPILTAADGSFTDSFAVTMKRDYRYIAWTVDDQRQVATSAPFQFTDAPKARVEINSTTTVVFPTGATRRTLLLQLDEGQTFTYAGPLGTSVADPSGAPVSGFDGQERVVTAVTPLTGDYTIAVTLSQAAYEPVSVNVVLSKPVVVPTALDAPGQDIAGTLPGQLVDLVFAADADSVVSEYTPRDPQAGDPPGSVSLFDPSGSLVPRWGQLVRNGPNWRLPSITGDYALRITPDFGGLVDRRDISVLAAHMTSMTLDGEPGHVSLDRPGRVAVATATVPDGQQIRLSDTGPDHLDEELFGPDGARIQTYNSSPDIKPSVAGTYSQLVSYPWGNAEVDYYASTPVIYDVEVGSSVRLDQGVAPDRLALVRIPVTTGQLFSFELLDEAGTLCPGWTHPDSGHATLGWLTESNSHPAVVRIAQDGELELRVTPCTATGTVRLVPTEVVPSVDVGTTYDEFGYPTTTSTAKVDANVPGQVVIVQYHSSPYGSNHLELDRAESSFPDGTNFVLAHADPGSSSSTAVSNGTTDPFPMTLYNIHGSQYFFVYAGPTATGSFDLKFSRLDY